MPEQSMETWEKEILARHRWGQHGEDVADAERIRLRKLCDAAGPLDAPLEKLVGQIIGPEICNWQLEEMTLALCDAIGRKEPLPFDTGHRATVTDARYSKGWAYYLSLRHWQHNSPRQGFRTLLVVCDPDGNVEQHVLDMLGEREELKELYVERLCLCLEVLLGERYPEGSAHARSHEAATTAVEKEIRKHDPKGEILGAISEYRGGDYLSYINLEFCHHKFFRRLDILISSIGVGKWRAAMPECGTDGFGRSELVEKYAKGIDSWISSAEVGDKLSKDVAGRLGEVDPTKVFLASLLASLLRSQALSARQRAEKRSKE